MPTLRVLYDGWALARRLESPACLHLLALLARLPEEVEALVALPEEPPGWLPPNAAPLVRPAPDTASGRLAWEQRRLPRLTAERGADLLHLTSPHAPLFGKAASAVSPAEFEGQPPGGRGLAARLRAALGRGGLARVGLLWPDDLPAPRIPGIVVGMPPAVHPDFSFTERPQRPAIPGLDLPLTYCLYHGPGDPASLYRLLEAWSWAAGAVGPLYPLVLLGLDEGGRRSVQSALEASNFQDSVRIAPRLAPSQIAALYQGCAALYHPAAVSPWGGPLRHALACGKPVVALEGALAEALVGPAAYLVPAGEGRKFGAAMVTVVVEESVANKLKEAAAKRAASWNSTGFADKLLAAYRQLTNTSAD